MSPTNYQDPNQQPDFIQQILSQSPAPPVVPFAEENRINDLENQHTALLPQNQLASLDPFARNKRTGANNTRSKKDKAGTALAYIAEFLNAASGGDKYKNPYQRARAEAIENYKLQSPRIIDELKILNQNKRAYEADQSRERLAQVRNSANIEAVKLSADAKRYATDKTFQSAQDKINLLKQIQKWHEKYGDKADPNTIALMQSVNYDLNKPENAQAFVDASTELTRGNTITKGLATALGMGVPTEQNVTRTARVYNSDVGDYVNNVINSTRMVRKPNPLVPPLLEKLLPKQFKQTNQNPQNIDYSLGNLLPNAAKPSVPQVENKKPAIQKPLETAPPLVIQDPKDKPIGAVTPARLPVDKVFDLNNATETIEKYKPLKVQKVVLPDNDIQSRIWRIQQSADGSIIQQGINGQGYRIDPRKLFPGKGRAKERERFEGNIKAATAWSGLADLAVRQYLKHKGQLLTGFGTDAGKTLLQNAPQGGILGDTVGELMRSGGKAVLGRDMDIADDFINIKSMRLFLEDLYKNSGMQISQRELDLFDKLNPSTSVSPDYFLQRILRLAIVMNQQVQDDLNTATGRGVSVLAPPTEAALVKRVDQIMSGLRDSISGRSKVPLWTPALLRPIKQGL